MTSILDLLQQKSSQQVVKQILKNGKANWKEIDLSIFQFFIDIFGKHFEFTEEHYDEIDESTVDFESLAVEIYDTKDTDDESVEIKLREFMSCLIDEAFIGDYLTDSVVSNWVTFLATVAEHLNIPKSTKMRATACLLLTFMLVPLTRLMALTNVQEVDLDENLQTAIKRSVQRILNNISSTFEYEKFSSTCAKEFSEVLLTHHAILLQDTTYLNNYRTMLMYDNRPLLSIAIKGIEDLCQVETLEDVMKEFLFTAQNEEETVVQIIIKMINFKNLKHEVLSCLKSIAKLRHDHEIAISNNYSELFINLFSKSKKTIAETAELMVTLQVDFWYELIKMLNFYTNDDDVDLKLILTSISTTIETDLKLILEFIVQHKNEPIVSRRAAEIFNEAFELSYAKEECIAQLINTMDACTNDEMTFIILLQTFISIDNKMLVTFLKENVNYLTQHLMRIISNAFLLYQKPSSLNLVVVALEKLYIIEPITILSRVRDITNEYHNHLMNLENVEFTEREKVIPKLSALFECKSWRLVSDKSMIELYNFCQKFCTNINYKFFPQFQRFYVNLLKHFWMMLATNKPLLIENEKFIKDTRNIHTQIHNALKCSKNNVADNCLMLASLIDLYMLFQPKITERLENQFFKTFSIQLSKEDFIRLIDLMEKNLFPETDDSAYYQQLLIQSFVVLNKNYINLPSLTSWEVFLRYYSMKSLYKTEIEALMTQAIAMKKSIFEKSVAFAVLNIAAMNNLEHFRAFFNAFDDFMRKSFTDYKARNVAYGLICSIVLERFSRQVNANEQMEEDEGSRLFVLDCIGIIIKNLDQSFTKNLLKFIRIDENSLTEIELRKLNDFKRVLAEN